MYVQNRLFKELTWLRPSALTSSSCLSQANCSLSASSTFSFSLSLPSNGCLSQVIADIPTSPSFHGTGVADFSSAPAAWKVTAHIVLEMLSSAPVATDNNVSLVTGYMFSVYVFRKWLLTFLHMLFFCITAFGCSDYLRLMPEPWLIQAKNDLQPSFFTSFCKDISLCLLRSTWINSGFVF